MSLARDNSILADLGRSNARDQPAVPISLNVMSPLVAIFDLTWIVLLGVAAGLLYDAVALDGQGAAQDYVGSGIAVATLYSAFGHAAQLYRAPNLLRLRWQVGRSTLTWLMTFVFLATLAFLLKIGAAFSRGEMLVFFSSGVILTAVMRLAVARVCTLVISSGALKPNRIVLVGLVDQLTGNEALTVLEKYGYAVERAFPLPTIQDGICDEEALKTRLREIIHYVREMSIDEIIVAIPWSLTDLIGEVESGLRVLPVPVKLVPDTIDVPCAKSSVARTGPDKGGTTSARSA